MHQAIRRNKRARPENDTSKRPHFAPPPIAARTAFVAPSGGMVSAWRNHNTSPQVACAPAFIWRARPRPVTMTESQSGSASRTVSSVLPPSTTTTLVPGAPHRLQHSQQSLNDGGFVPGWDDHGNGGHEVFCAAIPPNASDDRAVGEPCTAPSHFDVLEVVVLFAGQSAVDTIFRRVNGAVAQLGERRVRNAKVGSSILLRSTKSMSCRRLGSQSSRVQARPAAGR